MKQLSAIIYILQPLIKELQFSTCSLPTPFLHEFTYRLCFHYYLVKFLTCSLQFGDNLSEMNMLQNQSNSKMFYNNSGISHILIFLELLLRLWKKKKVMAQFVWLSLPLGDHHCKEENKSQEKWWVQCNKEQKVWKYWSSLNAFFSHEQWTSQMGHS